MRQDLFGLNHSEIMGKLKARIEKEAAILTEHSSPQPSCSKGATLIPFDKSTFSKYYARQRILQKKLRHNEELLIEDYDTDDDAIHENEERDPDHFS